MRYGENQKALKENYNGISSIKMSNRRQINELKRIIKDESKEISNNLPSVASEVIVLILIALIAAAALSMSIYTYEDNKEKPKDAFTSIDVIGSGGTGTGTFTASGKTKLTLVADTGMSMVGISNGKKVTFESTGGVSGGTPGGVAGNVQFNSGSNTFLGESDFTYDNTSNTLDVNNVTINQEFKLDNNTGGVSLVSIIKSGETDGIVTLKNNTYGDTITLTSDESNSKIVLNHAIGGVSTVVLESRQNDDNNGGCLTLKKDDSESNEKSVEILSSLDGGTMILYDTAGADSGISGIKMKGSGSTGSVEGSGTWNGGKIELSRYNTDSPNQYNTTITLDSVNQKLTFEGLSGGTTSIGINESQISTLHFILPGTSGINGQVVTTDGSGNLSFTSASGVSTINGLNDASSDGNNFIDSIMLGQAVSPSSSSQFNTAVGISAMTSINGGTSNVVIGYNAGGDITTGNNLTIIGASAGSGISGGNNLIVIGANATHSGNSDEITLGNSSHETLRVGTTVLTSLSDGRDKTNIENTQYGLDFLMRLRPVDYTWQRRNLEPGDANNPKNGKRRSGFIAQELLEAAGEDGNQVLDLVYDVNPERLEARYGNLIPSMVKSIQQLENKVRMLEDRLSER